MQVTNISKQLCNHFLIIKYSNMQTKKAVAAATKKVNKVNNAKTTPAKKAVAPVAKPKLVLTPQQTATAKKLIAKLNTPNQLQAPGLIKQILQLYTNGFTCAQIIAHGFNKSTVYRQTRALNLLKAANQKKQLTAKGVQMLTGKNA
jgi:hypothetical protein